MGSFVLLLSFVLIALAIHLFVKTILRSDLSVEDQERLGIGLSKKDFPSPMLKLAYPLVKRIVPSVVQWKKIEKDRYQIRRKLSSAGLLDLFTPDEFYSYKIVFAFLVPTVVYIYNILVKIGLPIYYAPIFAFFGWIYPNMWINGVIKERQETIKREMPFVVDLLTLCVEAGLDFGGAIGKVVEKGSPGPLKQEFETIVREIKIGAMRSEALKNMADRVGLKEVSSFVSILVTAERMGSPIGSVLRAQSDAIRHERFMAAEAKGGKAATKVLIPMAIFILPAVFIVIFGPILLKNIYGG